MRDGSGYENCSLDFTNNDMTIMKRQVNYCVLFILFLHLFTTAFPHKYSSRIIYEKLQPWPLPGTSDTILTGTYSVYENRATNTGKKIDLNIVLIPALQYDSACAPVFVLEGGPGVGAANPFNV